MDGCWQVSQQSAHLQVYNHSISWDNVLFSWLNWKACTFRTWQLLNIEMLGLGYPYICAKRLSKIEVPLPTTSEYKALSTEQLSPLSAGLSSHFASFYLTQPEFLICHTSFI
jgi:hypothetical protein